MRACKNIALRSGFNTQQLRTDESARVDLELKRCCSLFLFLLVLVFVLVLLLLLVAHSCAGHTFISACPALTWQGSEGD